jgi:hypothetical protein
MFSQRATLLSHMRIFHPDVSQPPLLSSSAASGDQSQGLKRQQQRSSRMPPQRGYEDRMDLNQQGSWEIRSTAEQDQ